MDLSWTRWRATLGPQKGRVVVVMCDEEDKEPNTPAFVARFNEATGCRAERVGWDRISTTDGTSWETRGEFETELAAVEALADGED